MSDLCLVLPTVRESYIFKLFPFQHTIMAYGPGEYHDRLSFHVSICDTHRSPREHLQCANVALLFENVSAPYLPLLVTEHGSDSIEKSRATVAGDKQVRVFDVAGHSPVGQETIHSTSESAIRVLRCHSGRVKRIIVEDSPDLFLTVAEV